MFKPVEILIYTFYIPYTYFDQIIKESHKKKCKKKHQSMKYIYPIDLGKTISEEDIQGLIQVKNDSDYFFWVQKFLNPNPNFSLNFSVLTKIVRNKNVN